MKILIDVGHPSDVHLFRNFYFEMTQKGHQILFTARNKEVTYELLDAYNLNYKPYGKPFKSAIGKLFGILKFDIKLYRIAKKFKPDLFFCHGSFYASHVALFLKKPFITFEDTGNVEQIMLYKYFSDVIITPDSFIKNLGKKHIRFKGTKELAYTHPNRFKPNINILKELGLKQNEKYVLLRFVGWNASHDIGHKGILFQNKLKAIEELSKYAKVFISSERELPSDLTRYKISAPAEKILDILYYADLLYGESATMATEAAMFGVPAIYLDNTGRCYTRELEEKYDMLYNFSESEEDQLRSVQKAIELIRMPDLKKIWHEKSKKMIEEQIDLTAFMVWFIESYPQSFKIIKENPDYQFKFN